jgi:hypothetical protein
MHHRQKDREQHVISAPRRHAERTQRLISQTCYVFWKVLEID